MLCLCSVSVSAAWTLHIHETPFRSVCLWELASRLGILNALLQLCGAQFVHAETASGDLFCWDFDLLFGWTNQSST